jgi:site-specific recombinase XerD
MIEDMTVRGFKEDTRRDYVRNVRAFAAFIGRSPDTATAEDLRLFQLHQTQSGMQPPSINNAVSALRFFFTVTLDRPDLARRLTVVPYPRRIPVVLSVEEVTLLLRAATAPKYKAAFATAYGAGLRASEVVALKVSDIDSKRMLLRVERGKGGKDRHAMLSPQLLGLLRVCGGRVGGVACCCQEAGCFPAATRSNRCRLANSVVPSTLPPKLRGSKSTSHHIRCGTASPRICSNKMSIFA